MVGKYTDAKMKARQNYPPLPVTPTSQFDDSNEGGLDLGQFLAVIRRQFLVVAGVTSVVDSAALLKTLSDTPVYQASFEILTASVTAETEVISSLPETLGSKEKAPSLVLDQTKLRLLQSPKVLSPVVKQLQTKYPDISYGSLSNNLTMTPLGKDTNILQVAYQSPDPEEVRVVLNLVAKGYLNYSLEERNRDIRKGSRFLEEQLPKIQARVETLQGRLQKFRQQYNSINPETQGEQLSDRLGTLEQQQQDIQTKLAQARYRAADLQTELAQQPVASTASSVLNENVRYQKLLEQIIEIDSQIALASARFTEDSPTIQELQEKRQNLVLLLSREVQLVQRGFASTINEMEIQNQFVTQAISSLNLQLQRLPMIARQYADIQRELQIANNNLNQFLTKREALQIDAAQKEVPWQLLTPPGQPRPSATPVKQNLLLGTVLGLLLGVGAALVVDKLRNVIHTAKEIKSITRLPILGVVPLENKIENLAFLNENTRVNNPYRDAELTNEGNSQRYKTSRFYEAFRSLYTNIRLLNTDTPIRSLVISSAAPEEGKSTVAAHLAQAAAAMGRRVLLVDVDLRHPSLHAHFGLMNEQGLTNIIYDNLDFKDAITRSPSQRNLFVLPTGLVPSDPLSLLASQEMLHLMDKLQAAFDLVIYDTPPLTGLADAHLMAAHTHGLLLVVGLGQLRRSLLEETLDELKTSSIQVLGIVANKSKTQTLSSLEGEKAEKPAEHNGSGKYSDTRSR